MQKAGQELQSEVSVSLISKTRPLVTWDDSPNGPFSPVVENLELAAPPALPEKALSFKTSQLFCFPMPILLELK